MDSTRFLISCPMLVANFVGHKGLVRWKWTMTRLPSICTSSRRPSSPSDRRISGSRVDPAALRTASLSIAVVIVSLSPRCRYRVLSLRTLAFDGLELALDINAVEPGDVATDDFLLGLIGEIHSIFGFQIFW